MMLLEKLRTVTGESHQQLEKAMLPIIVRVNDRRSYASLLRLFYGFYKPLQEEIVRHLDKRFLPDHATRREPAWLLNDLAVIGEDGPDIQLCENTPTLNSNAAVFGALYVMEGSTLGGKAICKILSDNLRMEPPGGLSFFYGYGKDTASRWKEFLASLDRFSGTTGEPAVIATADQVFRAFSNWINKVYLPAGEVVDTRVS